MAIKITNSLEWSIVETDLRKQIRNINNWRKRTDATKMLDNLAPMITKLSKLEVQTRRSPSQSQRMVDEHLDIINDSVLNLEQWIILCLLS